MTISPLTKPGAPPVRPAPQRPAANAPSSVPGGRMTIASLQRGVNLGPPRILLYGKEGIGKTTFGAEADAPVFIGPEEGYGLLDVTRFPAPHSWREVLEALRTLEKEPHEFKTVVIDTLDWLEPLCWRHVCENHPKHYASIEDFGFGKGYVAAVDEWRVFIAALERVRSARKMQVILLAHAKIAKFKNPEGEDYDWWTLMIHDKAAGLFSQWVDAVLFAQFRTVVAKDKGAMKAKAIGEVSRVLHTVRRPTFEAKNRLALPAVLPLSWKDFAQHATNPRTAPELLADIREMCAGMPPEDAAKVITYAEKNHTDRARLVEVLNKLRAMDITVPEPAAADSTNTTDTTTDNTNTTEPNGENTNG